MNFEFAFKHEPFNHQMEEWRHSRETDIRAIFWEQGTGKTKLTIDTALWLYSIGEIDAVLVIAPNGVHDNWTEDEIPEHIPEHQLREMYVHCYQSRKRATKWHQKSLRLALHHPRMAWVCMSYDAIMTEAGRKFVWEFLKKRKVMYVLDEASEIKSPGAKRTKRIVASGAYAKYKRILEGTPVTQAPFDVQYPMKFLDKGFWVPHELDKPAEFRSYFGLYETGYNKAQEREFQYIVAYRRLNELREMLIPYMSRVLKKDVLDLPPKLYGKRYYDLNPEQKRLYEELKAEAVGWTPNGALILAQLPIVKQLRFAQITSGYVPVDDPSGQGDPQPTELLGKRNPRLDLLMSIVKHLPHKAIIWGRFHMDMDLIMHAMKKEGYKAVVYDGRVKDDDRIVARHSFQKDDKVQFFVGNPQAAGRGLTLHAAQTVTYYNNSFRFKDRLQSEDRAHRIGQVHPVNYLDLLAKGTIDTQVVANLRRKLDVATQVTGDEQKEWI